MAAVYNEWMRLWSIHPKYLDAKGLTALWREALLARAVLRGATRGYRRHPQLERFRQHATPLRAIEAYLWEVLHESRRRGYRFDAGKLRRLGPVSAIGVNRGQVAFEVQHLLEKVRRRDPGRWEVLRHVKRWDVHPLMRRRPGGVEDPLGPRRRSPPAPTPSSQHSQNSSCLSFTHG